MDPTNSLPRRLQFGCFEADLRTGELIKQGKRLHLQEQPFRLLAMLLERPGELVTREEVRQTLWPQSIVDFDHGLNKAISKIRDALGDSAEKPRCVETVARRGYRFLADVTSLPEEEPQSTATRESSSVDAARVDSLVGTVPESLRHRPLRLWIASGATLTLLLLAAVGLFPWPHSFTTIHSVAVLPLQNLSGDTSQEYFADGMTDELITQLGQIRALRVISRTSVMTYKNARKPLAEHCPRA